MIQRDTDNASPAEKSVMTEQASDAELLMQWMREPDNAEEFALAEAIDWMNRRPIAVLARMTAALDKLRTSVEVVASAFEKDEAQGFHTKDRQFAIDILRLGLSADGPSAWSDWAAELDRAPPLKCTWPECDQPSGYDFCFEHCLDRARVTDR